MFTTLAQLRPMSWRLGINSLGISRESLLFRIQQRYLPRQSLLMLHDAVASNAVKKCAQRAAFGVILFRLPYQSHEDVLNNFLSSPGVSRHTKGKAINRPLVTAIEERESLLVAICGAPQQNVIAFSGIDLHFSWLTPCIH